MTLLSGGRHHLGANLLERLLKRSKMAQINWDQSTVERGWHISPWYQNTERTLKRSLLPLHV